MSKKPEQIQRRCDPLKWAKVCGTPPPLSPWCLCPPTLHVIIHHDVFKIICSCSFYAFRCTGTDRLLCIPAQSSHVWLRQFYQRGANCVASGPRQSWPKKVKECDALFVRGFPTEGLWWPSFRTQEGVKCRGSTAFCSRKSPTHRWSCVWWGCENITSNKRKKRGISIIHHHVVKESLDYYSKSVTFITVDYYRHHYCFLFFKSLKVIMISTQSIDIGTFGCLKNPLQKDLRNKNE